MDPDPISAPSPDPPPHSLRLRAGRWSSSLHCYAITKCVENRRQVLANPSAANTILESLKYLRGTAKIRLLAFCIMPDHWHALFFLLPAAELSKAMESLSKFTARRRSLPSRPPWEKG